MASSVRFCPPLRELRIHLCQSGAASKGVRDFIEKYYVTLKYGNPRFPILIRECSDVEPRLWVRFSKGKENSVSLKDLSSEEILEKLQGIAK